MIIKDNEIINFLVSTELDTKSNPYSFSYDRVLIQYVRNPLREKLFYQIYHNKLISENDLEKFNSFDLRLIRNFIFAKHNYSFKNKFLTAFYNMYNFYESKRSSRCTDVNSKLSSSDKKNLILIRIVEKSKK